MLAVGSSEAAQTALVEGTTIVTVGSCNVTAVGNFAPISITGCNDIDSPKYREKLEEWFGTTEYGRLLERMAKRGAKLQSLITRTSYLERSHSVEVADLARLSEELRALGAEQVLGQQQQNELAQRLVDSARREFADATASQYAAVAALDAQARENQARISDAGFMLSELRDKVFRLETDVGYLMKEFHAGRFDKTLLFISVGVGAMARHSQLNPRFDLTSEFLTPRYPNLTILLEASYIDWIESSSYSTLAGLEQQSFRTDFSRTSFGIGAMYSLSIGSGSVRLSFGGIHGMSLAKIANAEYRAALLRTTWARQSLLVSLEIRAEDLKQVVQRREFNELGNATVTFETEKRVVPAAALRVSMRIR